MPTGHTRVQPGDLITAEWFNDLLLRVEEIEQRLDALKPGTGPSEGLAITGRIPATGPYRVGDTLTLLGRNFQFSLGAARVFLNGIRVLNMVTGLGGSSDTQLVFVIPPVPGLAETGTEVTLQVLNQTEQATTPLVLRPALPQLFGDVDVTWDGAVTPRTFQPGQAVSFEFGILSRASLPADFLIDPVIEVATSQSVWQSRLQVRDTSQNPIQDRRMRLTPLEQRLFVIHLTEVPAGTSGTQFTLTVNASSGAVTGTSGAIAFQVGQAAPEVDTTILLAPTQATPASALVGDTVTTRADQPSVQVRFNAEFEQPGIYDLTLPLSAGTTGWTVNRFINTPAFFDIPATSIPAGGRAARPVEITIQPAAGASATGRVEVRLQRRGATHGRSFPLNLRLGT